MRAAQSKYMGAKVLIAQLSAAKSQLTARVVRHPPAVLPICALPTRPRIRTMQGHPNRTHRDHPPCVDRSPFCPHCVNRRFVLAVLLSYVRTGRPASDDEGRLPGLNDWHIMNCTPRVCVPFCNICQCGCILFFSLVLTKRVIAGTQGDASTALSQLLLEGDALKLILRRSHDALCMAHMSIFRDANDESV